MKMVDNARAVLKHAWTVRVAILGAICNFLSVYLSVATAIKPSLWLAALAGICCAAVPFLRVVKQKKVSGDGCES